MEEEREEKQQEEEMEEEEEKERFESEEEAEAEEDGEMEGGEDEELAYEEQRQRNIAYNQAMLHQLGLTGASKVRRRLLLQGHPSRKGTHRCPGNVRATGGMHISAGLVCRGRVP